MAGLRRNPELQDTRPSSSSASVAFHNQVQSALCHAERTSCHSQTPPLDLLPVAIRNTVVTFSLFILLPRRLSLLPSISNNKNLRRIGLSTLLMEDIRSRLQKKWPDFYFF